MPLRGILYRIEHDLIEIFSCKIISDSEVKGQYGRYFGKAILKGKAKPHRDASILYRIAHDRIEISSCKIISDSEVKGQYGRYFGKAILKGKAKPHRGDILKHQS